MDWGNWCSVSWLCQEQGAVVSSGAGLPQERGFGAQSIPGISTEHSWHLHRAHHGISSLSQGGYVFASMSSGIPSSTGEQDFWLDL